MKTSDVQGSQVSRRWAAGLLMLGLVGLSGCGLDGLKPPSTYREYTAEELRRSYVEEPTLALPAQSGSPLGENYQLSGTVKNWNHTRTVSLYGGSSLSTTPPVRPANNDAQLSPTGELTAVRPLLELATSKAVRDALSLTGTTCPLDTLKVSSAASLKVLLANFAFFLEDEPKAQTLRPQTSPARYTRPVVPAGGQYTLLLWAAEPMTIQGEVRCLGGGVQTTEPKFNVRYQVNTTVNQKLERGWNALAQTVISSSTSAEGVQAINYAWNALPAAELKTWVALN